MNKIDIKQAVIELMGYTEVAVTCSKCRFCEIDPSTDNFGSGDQCKRNPDVTFRVNSDHGHCTKFEKRT